MEQVLYKIWENRNTLGKGGRSGLKNRDKIARWFSIYSMQDYRLKTHTHSTYTHTHTHTHRCYDWQICMEPSSMQQVEEISDLIAVTSVRIVCVMWCKCVHGLCVCVLCVCVCVCVCAVCVHVCWEKLQWAHEIFHAFYLRKDRIYSFIFLYTSLGTGFKLADIVYVHV